MELVGVRHLKGENMGDVRKNNRARMLEILLKYGLISRAEISEICGLTPPAITALANELLNEGLLEEFGVETVKSVVGRRRMQIRLINDARLAIGVEIGVKRIIAGIVDLSGKILKKETVLLTGKEPEMVIRQTSQLINNLLSPLASKVIGIGVAATGLVDSEAGIIKNSPNLGWKNIKIQAILESEVSKPVALDNNVRLMALGENTFFNAWDKTSRLILIHVGYGIGCGIILNGQLYYGNSFGAGELGHTIVLPDGPLCSCGKSGCLETLASGRAITAAYVQKKALGNNEYSEVWDEMFKKAANQDVETINILSQAGTFMGYGIVNLLNILAPDSIILHGTVFQAEFYTNKVMQIIKSNHYGDNDRIVIKHSQGQDELVVLGAGALAIQKFLIDNAQVS
jgi:predicted NBD/HSP70 family sugar kinase